MPHILELMNLPTELFQAMLDVMFGAVGLYGVRDLRVVNGMVDCYCQFYIMPVLRIVAATSLDLSPSPAPASNLAVTFVSGLSLLRT